jgi:hypothetical protein
MGYTKSMCELSEIEKAYFSLLPLSRKFEVEGDKMYVYHGGELIMAFKRK